MHRSIFTLILGVAWATSSLAEVQRQFAPVYYDTDHPGVFAISGTIGADAAAQFDQAIAAFGAPDVLSLVSAEGDPTAALAIAERVRARGIDTHIQSGEQCLSAFALIFFGGAVRNAEGDLGLHQLTAPAGGTDPFDYTSNTILPALTALSVPSPLLVALLRTPPEEMYLVSEDEKTRFGLIQTAVPDAPAETSPERRAVQFLADYFFDWSKPTATALEIVRGLFAERVDFYGKSRSYAEVIEEKRSFTRTWPERDYSLLGDTVSVSCAGSQCYLSGQYIWQVRNPANGSRRSGLADVTMTLRQSATGFLIVAEDGKVLRRD